MEDKLQQLIEWMEEEKERHYCIMTFEAEGAFYALKRAIEKAKELQATEQCKWAVVDKSAIFDSKEDAEQHFYTTFCNNLFHTIVKIMEP
jgi:Lhr-like helicase